MRVGKKPIIVDAKKTRSCVVRLEKVGKNSPNVSPSPEDSRTTTRNSRLTTTTMTPTPKSRRGIVANPRQEEKPESLLNKKRVVNSNFSHQQQQKLTNSNTSPNLKSNQKIKTTSKFIKETPASTPPIDETPPPTIAAGRSRRAIKPNPKYASEDVVTPKVVRNVAHLGSSSGRSGYAVPGAGGTGRNRKESTSSDDFYNRNSEDEYDSTGQNEDDYDDDDLNNDKIYQVNEKDEQDSDYSVIEEQHSRSVRIKGRPKKVQEPTLTTTPQHTYNKLPTQTASSNVKRTMTTTSSVDLRSAPSQLQQIRRSLAFSNTQRGLNMLGSIGSAGQKRKLDVTHDSSDNDSGYTISRKQLLLSNSSGGKVKVPVRDNRVNATSTPITKNRLGMHKFNTITTSHQLQQTLNGSNKINYSKQTLSRRPIEISAKTPNPETTMKYLQRQSTITATLNNQKTQHKTNILTTQATKANRFRSGSPKLTAQKEKQNSSAISISSESKNISSNILGVNRKTSDKSSIKPKPITSFSSSAVTNSENRLEFKEDSPNSTMDDFETMPTFTIVNVNDIINKKGDVLITKSKLNSDRTPTVIEFSESISLDDDNDDDYDNDNEAVEKDGGSPLPEKKSKLGNVNRIDVKSKKFSVTRASNESLRKLPTSSGRAYLTAAANQEPPHILNHKLGLRSSRIAANVSNTLTATLTAPEKPAPRILNSVVAKKTQPVKPMIANMDDSADESFPLSLDDDEDDDDNEREEETEDEIESRTANRQIRDKNKKREQHLYRHKQKLMKVDNEDTESQNTEEDDVTVLQASKNNNENYNSNSAALPTKHNKDTSPPVRRRRTPNASNTPIVVSSNKKRLTPAAAKENSLVTTNQQVNNSKHSNALSLSTARKSTAEKVVISKQGDKIIKKITCFETWYVINMPIEPKRPIVMKNQLEMSLIRLANNAKSIRLPNHLWSSKVTLYELSPQTLAKGTFATFTGDLIEHNINEDERAKYQPTCVMFRRSIEKSQLFRMPYDRAVIFKNKTFYTNIEGKNVRLVGAPSIINTETEIEILLGVVDGLTLQSEFVEHISIVQ